MTPEQHVKTLKRAILDTAFKAKEGHIASAFSVLDALYVLYNGENPVCRKGDYDSRDWVILSKGHGCLAHYVVLADAGFFPRSLLDEFCTKDGKLGGHPFSGIVPGIEASTGSLGHGLPIAVGIAKALLISGKPNRVFCIVGDGELNEGSNWEALMLAEKFSLTNLCIIVDNNHSGDRAISYGQLNSNSSLERKLTAFGCYTVMVDGHNHTELDTAFKIRNPFQPVSVIMETVKGYGIQEMENNPAWHHRSPTAEELARFKEELT